MEATLDTECPGGIALARAVSGDLVLNGSDAIEPPCPGPPLPGWPQPRC